MGPGRGAQRRLGQSAALGTFSPCRTALATKQAATTTTDQVLSAAEQAQFRATLAAAGNSDSDLSYHQGQWRLGSAPASGDSAAGGSASRDTTEPVRKIETELRTLWVSPYTLRIRFTSLHGVRRRRLNPRFSSPTPPPGSWTPPRQKLRHPGAQRRHGSTFFLVGCLALTQIWSSGRRTTGAQGQKRDGGVRATDGSGGPTYTVSMSRASGA
jgi:hypothetical protein